MTTLFERDTNAANMAVVVETLFKRLVTARGRLLPDFSGLRRTTEVSA